MCLGVILLISSTENANLHSWFANRLLHWISYCVFIAIATYLSEITSLELRNKPLDLFCDAICPLSVFLWCLFHQFTCPLNCSLKCSANWWLDRSENKCITKCARLLKRWKFYFRGRSRCHQTKESSRIEIEMAKYGMEMIWWLSYIGKNDRFLPSLLSLELRLSHFKNGILWSEPKSNVKYNVIHQIL